MAKGLGVLRRFATFSFTKQLEARFRVRFQPVGWDGLKVDGWQGGVGWVWWGFPGGRIFVSIGFKDDLGWEGGCEIKGGFGASWILGSE